MTILQRVREMAARVTPPENRRFRVDFNEWGMVFVQCQGWVRDLTDPLNPGEHSWQGGAKHYVSEHACDNEIFQMMLGAVLAFDEHETREAFLVDHKRVFNPHISTAALALVCDDVEVRHG